MTLSPHSRLVGLRSAIEAGFVTEALQFVDELEEQFEAMDDALRDILDVTEAWTSLRSHEERLRRIDTIAKAALPKASGPTTGRVA